MAAAFSCFRLLLPAPTQCASTDQPGAKKKHGGWLRRVGRRRARIRSESLTHEIVVVLGSDPVDLEVRVVVAWERVWCGRDGEGQTQA